MELRELKAPLSGAFRQLGWGLVLVMININISGLDILPDFIGYIMAAFALNQLGRKHTSFTKAKWTAVILIAASLVQIIQGLGANFLYLGDKTLQLNLLSVGVLMLYTLLVYWIFEGLIAVAWAHQLRQLRHVAAMRRVYYLTVNVIVMILLPFSLYVPDVLTIVVLPVFGLLSLIAWFLLIRLCFRYAKEYIDTEKI
ncbi:hypothetical protein [Paenibacillus sp. YPG26]|uniref:hypothetical protein n=1 Tax=Paenibacillus sp. YPG26 TaxID=2878915 RepID=UPI002041171A|nr:hypothetical protein [Paenibacillus sp. YPG26]USB32985.1 hypothetical protein LDO05_17325 [Paenibacillus sp. YPG26]